MHTGPAGSEDRLWHERGMEILVRCDRFGYVLEGDHPVSSCQCVAVLEIDLMLPTGNLVM